MRCIQRVLWAATFMAAVVVPNAARAQEDCSRDAATTRDMEACASRVASATDSLRLVVERAVEDRLEFERLSEAQRARVLWEEYRENQCRFESREMGSLSLVLYLGCHAALGAERIERISVLVCEGSGPTGPCEESEGYRAALRRIRET